MAAAAGSATPSTTVNKDDKPVGFASLQDDAVAAKKRCAPSSSSSSNKKCAPAAIVKPKKIKVITVWVDCDDNSKEINTPTTSTTPIPTVASSEIVDQSTVAAATTPSSTSAGKKSRLQKPKYVAPVRSTSSYTPKKKQHRQKPVSASPLPRPQQEHHSYGYTHSSSAGLTPEEHTALEMHNRERAAHGAAPLSWDASLAHSAQQAANAHAYSYGNSCKLTHGLAASNGAGENLAASMGYSSPMRTGVDMWLKEKSKYHRPGFSMETGHYTQAVWKGTQRVGCALANNGCSYVVCHYYPA